MEMPRSQQWWNEATSTTDCEQNEWARFAPGFLGRKFGQWDKAQALTANYHIIGTTDNRRISVSEARSYKL